MGRSGYTDDYCDEDQWGLIRWRGAVNSALNGRRGQAFLKEMLAALDALPEKRLISSTLRNEEGDVCAMGAVCLKRGIDPPKLDEDDDYGYRDEVSKLLGIAPALAAEIAYMNDDPYRHEDGDETKRFERMRKWAVNHIRPEGHSALPAGDATKGEESTKGNQ